MLITFSGLDGAGKSTLIEWLRATLEAQRRPVAVLHMANDVGVYAYTRMLRDAVTGLVPRSNGAHDGPAAVASAAGTKEEGRPGRIGTTLRRIRNAIVWSTIIRRLIYPVDLVVFLCYRAYIEGIRQRVLIMDRYFYDTLVDVSGRGGGEGGGTGARWAWIRLLKLITPTPTLPVLLDIGPEESYARKGEYSVEYLRHRWLAYQQVFPWVRACVRIPNDDLATAKAALRRAVRERLGVR